MAMMNAQYEPTASAALCEKRLKTLLTLPIRAESCHYVECFSTKLRYAVTRYEDFFVLEN
jgi:ribosomal protein L40E